MTALVYHVERTAGAGVAVSAFLLAYSVPSLLGPIAGVLADRVDQRNLMIGSDVARCIVFVLLGATLPSFPLLLGVIVVDALLATMFRPAGRTAVPTLVLRDELMTANAWLTTALNVGSAVGPLLGGVLVASVGISGSLYADAATFALSALFLTAIPALPPEAADERPGILASTREGFTFVLESPAMRAVAAGLLLGVAAASLDNVALVFMATRVFDAGATGFGLLNAAFGLGMLVASLWLVRRSKAGWATSLFVLGWFGSALGNVGVGLAPAISIAVTAQLIGGAANAISLVGGDTLVHENVPKATMGRAFGVIGAAPFAGMLIAYASGGFLVDAFGARATFVISGVATALVAVAVAVMLRTATGARN